MEGVKASYILNNRGDWDKDLIQALFHPLAAAEILKIRLGSTFQQDRWVWGVPTNFFVISKVILMGNVLLKIL